VVPVLFNPSRPPVGSWIWTFEVVGLLALRTVYGLGLLEHTPLAHCIPVLRLDGMLRPDDIGAVFILLRMSDTPGVTAGVTAVIPGVLAILR